MVLREEMVRMVTGNLFSLDGGPDTLLTVVAPPVKRAFSGRTQHDTTATTPPSTDTLKADENTRVGCN